MCLARLKSMHAKESLDARERQLGILKGQFQEGIVEAAPPGVPQGPGKVVHYLPAQAIAQEGREDRVVYDASAKPKGGLSLNDCLEKGPSLIPSLVTILIGFRNQAIALSADIEKAFLQIGIDESDRDAIHFLWVADPRKGVGTESASSKICKSFFWPCYSTIHSKYGVEGTFWFKQKPLV